jgi:hypothetical protein
MPSSISPRLIGCGDDGGDLARIIDQLLLRRLGLGRNVGAIKVGLGEAGLRVQGVGRRGGRHDEARGAAENGGREKNDRRAAHVRLLKPQ